MSSNNILLILEGPHDTYRGYDVSVECEDIENSIPVFTAESMREAVMKANEYCRENMVEYGYQFSLKK